MFVVGGDANYFAPTCCQLFRGVIDTASVYGCLFRSALELISILLHLSVWRTRAYTRYV